MKKLYVIIAMSLFTFPCFAITIPVTVADFVFTPANFTAHVGDVVEWTWVSGFHNTTSSSVPAGAATWGQLITSGNLTFSYTITQPGVYNYDCTFHAGFGMVGSFTVSAVAPVTLLDFSATNSGVTVLLKWKTASEQNADHFSIQRSYDGMQFEIIGNVNASGNSSSEKNYFYLDENFSRNNRFLYYRLLTVDKDLKQQFSKIILHRQEKFNGKNTFITQLFPNPAKNRDHLHVRFDADKEQMMVVSLYDLTGKLLTSKNLMATEGVNQSHLPLPALIRGNYILTFFLDGGRESFALSIQ